MCNREQMSGLRQAYVAHGQKGPDPVLRSTRRAHLWRISSPNDSYCSWWKAATIGCATLNVLAHELAPVQLDPTMSLISSSGTPAGCVREAGIRKWRFVPLTPGAQAQSTTGICRRVRHRICEQTPICRPRQCEIPSVPPARGEYCRHHERSCR